MFHDVAFTDPCPGGGAERFTVSLPTFERMLDAIVELNGHGCTLADALEPREERRVGITFDDGTLGQFEHAVPALRARGMTATFFVTTDWVGSPGYMSWNQLRQLKSWGMAVESHTRSHPHLSELDASELRVELSDSKAALDRELSQETIQLALPGGNAPRFGLRRLVKEVGYRVIATSRWGRNETGSSRWIRRCTVPRSLSPELAQRIVRGDPRLALTRYTREAALNGVRALLGASRYQRWRRRVLDSLARVRA